MSNERKRPAKSVDLPPGGGRNRDPITKEPGAHPVEVGVGTALGGAAAGLAAGALAGPVGAVVGAVVGGVAGGYGGKAVGEAIDPTTKSKAGPAVKGRPAKAGTSRPKSRAASPSRTGAKAKRAAASTRAGAGPARRRVKAAATARAGGAGTRKRDPQDRARVNVNEPWEVDYWTEQFGVTPARLRQAVKKSGPMAKDVRRELGK